MSINFSSKFLWYLSSLLLSVAILFLFLTDPYKIGPQAITVWFIVVYIALTILVAQILKIISKRSGFIRHNLIFAAVVSAVPIGLLALNSLRQLNTLDVLFVIITAIFLGLLASKK